MGNAIAARINGKKGGRPKGRKNDLTLQAEEYRKVLVKKILENAEPLAQALIDKGLEKDVPALREIHDRALGKVKEVVEIKDTTVNIDV